MPDAVKPVRRNYDSTRRRQQAEATRLDIVRAAKRAFEVRGYAATSVPDVAAEAGVALRTVYLNFDGKPALVRAAWDITLRGETDQPVTATAWFQDVVDEPDPRRKLELNARNSRRGKERLAGMLRVIRDGAASDADMAALWDLIQDDYWDNQRAIVAQVHAAGGLRKELTVPRGADLLWTLANPDTWHLLVGRRKWTPARYEKWLAETSVAQLIG